MANKRKWFYGISVGVIIIICVVIFAPPSYRPPGNRMSDAQVAQIASNDNLQSLCYFVQKYESDNGGNAPRSLKDLAGYTADYLEVFYLPYRSAARPLDWSTNVSKIDQYGGYRLAKNPSAGVLVYEKPGAWSDGTIGVGLIGGKVNRLSSEEFEKLQVK